MSFENVKKNFGFGCMRLPMKDGEVDHAQFCQMIDAFFAAGFNYFDTAHGYIGGKSETAIRECLAKRYPREDYILVNKLSEPYFQTGEDIEPFLRSQLEACGVEYFDFYLMHAQNANNYKKYKACNAYAISNSMKEKGLIRHLGLSFHDNADVLDMILRENPEVEVVQLQFNYADYEDGGVQSRKCYEVCVKHGKPVIVMEPVKGGSLVNLPAIANRALDAVRICSNAGYAIRFAASFENIFMTLSGMSNMEQMEDNLSVMSEFKPLSEQEMRTVLHIGDMLRSQDLIRCTDCRYCVDGCPQSIYIPALFACMNDKQQNGSDVTAAYAEATNGRGKASDCIACGACEAMCPQKLPIRALLQSTAAALE